MAADTSSAAAGRRVVVWTAAAAFAAVIVACIFARSVAAVAIDSGSTNMNDIDQPPL
ncbi:hypothetical protein MYIN104542_30160 [Mycobacterium intermedium]